MRRAKSWQGWRTAPLAAALALAAMAAHAQISPQSSNGPIDITADTGDFSNQTCESKWSGSAEALQGDSRLRAAVIDVFLKKKPQAPGAKPAPAPAGASGDLSQTNCGQTDHIIADGDVFYQTPTQMARADHAVYTADNDQIVMTGNVVVVQGKNVARGDRMVLHVQNRVAEMYSNAKGRGTPGRVRAVLFPNQQGTPGGLGPPAHGAVSPATIAPPATDGGGGVQ